LFGKLPDYMIPAYFVNLEEFPLTSTGKIDRQALPAPEKIADEVEYEDPRNDVESKLVETWQQVLGKEKIGIHDDYFMMGGDSIRAIQIASRMKNYGYKLNVKDIFMNPTIGKLSSKVSRIDHKEEPRIDFSQEIPTEVLEQLQHQYEIEDIYPLTPMQEGMLFHSIFEKNSSVYFEQFSYRLHGTLDALDAVLVEKSFKRFVPSLCGAVHHVYP